MLALSGSKTYGPKSSGVLAVRRRLQIYAVQSGGDLQFGLRAGTYDIASIVGFTKALELANENRGITVENILRLKSLLLVSLHQLQDQYSDKIVINTPELSSPHIIHFSLTDIDSDYAVLYFDAADIAIASGSACNTSNGQISHVVRALWGSRGDSNYDQFAHIRISLGQYTTDLDIQAFIIRLKQLLIQTSQNSK
jgi:cysteine desulfurase